MNRLNTEALVRVVPPMKALVTRGSEFARADSMYSGVRLVEVNSGLFIQELKGRCGVSVFRE